MYFKGCQVGLRPRDRDRPLCNKLWLTIYEAMARSGLRAASPQVLGTVGAFTSARPGSEQLAGSRTLLSSEL